MFKVQKISLTFLIMTTSLFAIANEGGHHHEAGVPEVVKYQALNVGIIVIGLYFLLRKGIGAYFEQRRAEFLSAAHKAQEVKMAAEKEHQEIQVRLQKLESTQVDAVARARAEAVDMRERLIQEARELSKRIHEEASKAVQLEIEKAKTQLRKQMIDDAMKSAKQSLDGKVSNEQQSKLQNEFINNMGAVNP